MWKRWYAVLCLCVVDTDILQSVNGILPDIATLCPYNDFCHSKATKIRKPDESKLIPCCQSCSCAPDCELFGNCCPDKKIRPNVSVKYPCMNILTYFNDQRGVKSAEYDDLFLRIVDDCPNADLDLTYPRCSNIIELEDFVLVSDPSTERVYKNKHCALCNGITRYTEWRLLSDCPSSSIGRDIEEWHSYIKENCSIIPVPPDSTAGGLARCYQMSALGRSFRCNYTGGWETYDKDIEMACNAENPFTNNFYTHETIRHVKIKTYYENVYCKFCNQRQNESWSDLCEHFEPFMDGRGPSILSVFINFKAPTYEDVSMASECHQSQIWNPFKESCMTIVCPFSTYPHQGTCKDMYKHMPSQTYGFRFHVKSIDGINGYTKSLLHSIHGALSDLIDKTECRQCRSVLTVDSYSNYYLEYYVKTRGSCTEHFLLSKMKNVLSMSPFSLYIGYATNITMYFIPSYDNGDVTAVMGVTYERCPIFTFVTWGMIDKCARVPISYLDAYDSITQITTERYGTLCVDEYFKIMASFHNSQVTAHAQTLVIFAIIFVVSII